MQIDAAVEKCGRTCRLSVRGQRLIKTKNRKTRRRGSALIETGVKQTELIQLGPDVKRQTAFWLILLSQFFGEAPVSSHALDVHLKASDVRSVFGLKL